jgi:hypothetical protein
MTQITNGIKWLGHSKVIQRLFAITELNSTFWGWIVLDHIDYYYFKSDITQIQKRKNCFLPKMEKNKFYELPKKEIIVT